MAAKYPLDESSLVEHGAVKPSERQIFAEATRAARAGRHREAAALIDAKLEAEAGLGSLALRALRAKIDYQMRDYLTAAERFADVANEAEDLPSLRLNQALCLLRAEHWDEAFGVLFRLLSQLRREPNDAFESRLWGYIGVALEHMGRREDAETAYLAGGFDAAARRVRRQRLSFKLVRSSGPPSEAHPQPMGGPKSGRATLPPSQRLSPEAPPSSELASASSAYQATGDLRLESPRAREALAPAAQPLAHGPSASQPPSQTPKERRSLLPKPLLDTTLASLFVAESGAPLSRHPSGLVRGIARHDAPLAYDPRARFAASEDVTEIDPPPVALRTSGQHGFLRARSGVLLLRPRETNESLHLLELGDEQLTLDDRFVAAFEARLSSSRTSAPWPLEMLTFQGHGVVVLGLPEPFLSFDLRDAQRFEVPAFAVVGWVGELTAMASGEGPDPWSAPLRFSGNGTLLFLPTPRPGRAGRS